MLYLANADEEWLVSRMERVFSRRWHYALVTADHQELAVRQEGDGWQDTAARVRGSIEWGAVQNKKANLMLLKLRCNCRAANLSAVRGPL